MDQMKIFSTKISVENISQTLCSSHKFRAPF